MSGSARQVNLTELISSALPSRHLRVARQSLIDQMIERIEIWMDLNPQIAPHAKKVRELVKIADDLEKALETAGGRLKKLGVDDAIERIKTQNKAIGIEGKDQQLAGRDVAVDLFLLAWQAIDRVRAWNRHARPSKGRPRAFAAALSEQLEELCSRAGLTDSEFSDFLSKLSDRAGLPNFTRAQATAKKRAERSKKSPKTK